jgi:hypothetical protein
VIFAGHRENYTVIKNADGSFTVIDKQAGGDGEDALTEIEFIQFGDSSLDLVAASNPPASLMLAGSVAGVSLMEGSTEIGALTADQGGITWSFDTTADNGGDAGGMFVIENGTIRLATDKALEYDGREAVHAYTIVVKATNEAGVTSTHAFTISITNDPSDDNHAPTDIGLSNASVQEEAARGTLIGLLSAMDPDASDSFTFSL